MKRHALVLLLCLLFFASGGNAYAADINYVKMSGIPGTMIRVGQTCSLTAAVYYLDGSHSFDETISWESSNPSVAKIDQFGNLVSLRKGTAVISVTTAANGPNGIPASDLATLNVTESWSYSNIHPDVWSKLGYYNANMDRYGERLNFLDIDPAQAATSSFQGEFRSKYGVSPLQVTDLSDASAVAFDSQSAFGGHQAFKPSMKISVASLAKAGGSLLPVEFTYNLSWKEASEILERDVTSIQNNRELFEKINIVFQNMAGGTCTIVDENSMTDMLASNALQITNGNNGLTLTLKAMIADVNATDGAALIKDALIVPDGDADGTSAGSMWLVRKNGNSSGGDSGSTGGGCDMGLGILTLVTLPAFTRKIKKTAGR